MVKEATVRKGYKNTDIGLIPEEWEVKKLNLICDVRDGTHESPKYFKEGITFITSKNIVNGRLDFSDVTYISKEDAEHINRRSKVDKGDILMSMIGTIGNSVFIDFEPNFCIKNVALIKPEKVEALFLIQLLYSQHYQGYINEKLEGGIQKFVSLGVLRELDVPLPPSKPEQTAIANSLNDVDALISKLEEFIVKKRNIKQGAMQQLLTGKKRLPGFIEKWETKKLGEIFSLSATYSKTEFIDEGGSYLIMDMGSVSSIGQMIASKKTFLCTDLLKIGDLVMPKDDIGGGNIIGKVAYINQGNKYVLGDHVYKLTVKTSEADTLFFSYLINSYVVNSKLRKKVAGSAQLGLGRKSVEEQDVKIPDEKTEQIAIAQVLNDMDVEIERLEQKLAKYKMLKQGMMQELLTGKTRLI